MQLFIHSIRKRTKSIAQQSDTRTSAEQEAFYLVYKGNNENENS